MMGTTQGTMEVTAGSALCLAAMAGQPSHDALLDGERITYDDVAQRARSSMGSLASVPTTLLLLFLVALGGCGGERPALQDPDGTLDDIVTGMRTFAIANERYYAENGRFTADIDELQSGYSWAPDSVDLTIHLSEDAQGWSVLATHVRTGPEIGCVLVWGNAANIETPDGVPHDGSNLIVCDHAFDAATNRGGVSPPQG